MLVIREPQMEVLRRAALRQFLERLQRHLTEVIGHLPVAAVVDPEGTMQSARALGITRESDIARFGELMYRHAGGHILDGLPKKAQNILLAHGVEPAVRLERFAEWGAYSDEPEGTHA